MKPSCSPLPMLRYRLLMMVIASSALASACWGETPAVAAKKLTRFLERLEPVAPGYSVVVVTPDDALLHRATGVLRAGSEAAMTVDTPMYIGSQTKAYLGTLAARLDSEGILKLDDRIADHWPNLKLPGGVNAADWRLRDLLTHQVPIDCAFLTESAKYFATTPADRVPAILAQYATVREPGFKYANIGYIVWAAILETATGKTWQAWLDDYVIDELGLKRTSARSSDFQAEELPWRHTWLGNAGWHAIPPKSDAVCHAAGGIFTSARDMGRFLQWHLGGPVGDAEGLSAELLNKAHAAGTAADMELPDANELPTTGYALGWNLCDFDGHRLFLHGGAYDGVRSQMAFSPDLGIGVAVLTNSDAATGWLTGRIIVQYFQYLLDDPKAHVMAEQRIKRFPERRDAQLRDRQQKLKAAFSNAAWGKWTWQPAAAEQSEYVGQYAATETVGIPLNAIVTSEDGKLRLQVGEFCMVLKPARINHFATLSRPLKREGPVQFFRDAEGNVTDMLWRHHPKIQLRFRRIKDD